MIYASALAKHVHANGRRFQATGRVRDAEILYDRAFPRGACLIETAPGGGLRLISPDGSQCLNVSATDEGRLFKLLE